jgi:hypothetical protein
MAKYGEHIMTYAKDDTEFLMFPLEGTLDCCVSEGWDD